VLAVDPELVRRDKAAKFGIETFDQTDDVVSHLVDLTEGRGPDSVVDAVGMEAHGNPAAGFAQRAAGLLPDKLAQKAIETAGVDRLVALHSAIDLVRRGGTVSLSGVYGGTADPMPMMTLFDKQITIREGQCNVRRWIDDVMPLLDDASDPLGALELTTHRKSLEDAPEMYSVFQKKEDGCVKVVLDPTLPAAA
jgi:threonine dehydrogenase-like Zn-dependent dehydrogenase